MYTRYVDITYENQGITFIWNEEKATANYHKHGIEFKIATEVFFDPFLVPLIEEAIDGESRETVVGLTNGWLILYVVYTFRQDKIRLISARRVTKQERKQYEN